VGLSELLADVLAHPDDDAPRLVYADALTQAGDPRGELIAVQCAIAGGDHRPELARREIELLRDHGDAFALGDDIVCEFHRGFVDRVFVPSETMLERVDELFAREPIRHVSLDVPDQATAHRHARELATVNWPAGMRHLDFWPGLDTEDIVQIAESPHLANLATIRFPGHSAGDDALVALARASLPRLEELDFDLGPFPFTSYGSLGVLAVAASASLPALRGLSLPGHGDCEFVPGLETLAHSRLFAKLERLRLSYNQNLGDAFAAVVGGAEGPTSLDFTGCELGPREMAVLVASERAHRLARLELVDNHLGADGLQTLFASRLDGLRELSFHHLIHEPLDTSHAMFHAAWLDRLETLRCITPWGPPLLARLPWGRFASLRHLTIGGSDDHLAALAVHPMPRLEHLHLGSGITISPRGIAALARAPWTPRLRLLEIPNLHSEAAAALATAQLDELRVLSIGKTENAALRRIADMALPRLRELAFDLEDGFDPSVFETPLFRAIAIDPAPRTPYWAHRVRLPSDGCGER
jgi:uncharacterized protein (TIGR02996 family)